MSDPDKPPLEKVTLVPDQPLTPQEKQACTHFLQTYKPKIHWEVGQKVIAYIDTKIVNLYIREIAPRTRFFGYLPQDGEIHIVKHGQIGETPAPAAREPEEHPAPRSAVKTAGDPLLSVNRVPPGTEIQITIKRTEEKGE